MIAPAQQLHRMEHPTNPDNETQFVISVMFDGNTSKTYSYYWAHGAPPVIGRKVWVISPCSGLTAVTVVDVKQLIRSHGVWAKKYACRPSQYMVWVHAARRYAQGKKNAANSESTSYTADRKGTPMDPTSTFDNYSYDINLVPSQESPMNSPKIETITFVNGNNVNNMSDDQLIHLMQDVDKKIATLKELGDLPKRLAKRLETLEDDRKKLFELLDRDDA